MRKKRVCIIGGGPGAMEVLYQLAHYSQMQSSLDGKDIPEVVCYEKQSRPGGMWNLDWRVGKLLIYNLYSCLEINWNYNVTNDIDFSITLTKLIS